MCGIGGIYSFSGALIASQELKTFAAHLAHRGPNGRGCFLSADSRVGLLHTRLSILDLTEGGAQPMTSPDGRFTLSYNGEIYNFSEIAKELSRHGERFHTSSDTEVLLRGWQRYGRELLPKLNGMWAFAVYDSLTKKLTLCRDRFGVKPLYFLKHAARLLFASEAKALDAITNYSLNINQVYLANLGHSGLGNQSFLENVNSLPAGHILEVDPFGNVQEQKWYELATVNVPGDFQSQTDLIRSLIIDACQIRLRSDVPIATCLSGGIDSGSIVSVLNKFPTTDKRSQNLSHQSFTASFPGTTQDETDAARQLVQSFGNELSTHCVPIPSGELLEKALTDCDGPMPCLAFYPIWSLYRHIQKSGITVTLDGMGPDEALGGYYIGKDALRGALELRKFLWMRDLYNTYGDLYDHSRDWVRKDLFQIGREKASQLKAKLIGTRYKKLPPEAIKEPKNNSGNTLSNRLLNQFFEHPLPYLLHQYDRCSMANGVESRFPFMDYRFVEAVFSLPLQSRVGKGYTKRILREAMKGILPDIIRLKKRKTGFNAPFSDWLRGDLRTWLLDRATSRTFLECPFFDGKGLLKILETPSDSASSQIDEWTFWLPVHLTWLIEKRKASSIVASTLT